MVATSTVSVLSAGIPWRAYLELTKPRILNMVLITTVLGFFFGAHGISSYALLGAALLGTALTVGGACAINNYLERDVDSKMHRTKNRPIPSGTISPVNALIFGVTLVLLGTAFLVWKVNLLTGFLGLLSAFLYTLVYTPLKRITPLNTLIGAIPGALPPMGGWTAATGTLDLGAWVLFLILFAWQQPHFYAIAWMYRDDYERGGLKMLPVVEPDGRRTLREVIVYSILLIPLSLLPTEIGMAGRIYYIGAIFLGVYFLIYSIALVESRSVKAARSLLRASVVYLPILLLLIVADSTF